jgi:hypothetical protein
MFVCNALGVMLVAKSESQLALAIDSTVLVSVSVLDLGGKMLCSVETKRTTTIGEVKQLIQRHTGLEAGLSKLQLPDLDRRLRQPTPLRRVATDKGARAGAAPPHGG